MFKVFFSILEDRKNIFMSIFIDGTGFLVSNEDYGKISRDYNSNITFDYDELLEDAVGYLFNKTILKFEQTFIHNKIQLTKIITFNPSKNKFYLVNKNDFSYFKKRYFSTYKVIEREPKFYSFQIPKPEIVSLKNKKSGSQYEDRYNVSINGSTVNKIYRENQYTLRFRTDFRRDFSINNSDPLFQRDFSSIYNISEEYRKYLCLMMNVDQKKVNVNKLITPHYLLSFSEVKQLSDYVYSALDSVVSALDRHAQESAAEQYDDFFDLDQLNEEAFENDPDNYWNID